MTEHKKHFQLLGFARRLEVTYNQLFADVDLSIRQRWILEDIGYMKPMLQDGMEESKALRIVISGRLDAMRFVEKENLQ